MNGLVNISVDHATRMAHLSGFDAREEDGRLVVRQGENDFSLSIYDGLVSTLSFERSMQWLKDLANQEKARLG